MSAASAPQPPAEIAQPEKKAAVAKGGPARRAPILLELVYALFLLAVIGMGLGTALLSWLAGADLLMIVVRSGGACLVTGLLAWILYWQIANGVVEARRQQVLEEAAKQKAARAAEAGKAASTMEFEA